MREEIPKTGWQGLTSHWKNDIIAAVSVSLVALPLSLAIAVAIGIPPIAGLITAFVGGVVTTFFRSSKLAINGPAAGLIGVVLAAILSFQDESTSAIQAYQYVLAAIIVAGGLQVLIGLLKWGRIADIFPTTVIHGILASIGIIIFAKQMHVAMGTTSTAENTVGILKDIIYKLPEINPYIAIISGIGLVLLIFHARISYKVFHFIPAPVWVLAVSVPIVLLYGHLDSEGTMIFGSAFTQPENYLIDVESNWMDNLPFPDFSKVHTFSFWAAVVSINLLSTVITLAGAKAVDALDPYKRTTNMNRDLVGVGLSSMVSGALGGLPVITVIVRSTVNVHNKAKTKWSNFFHGLFIALFVLFLIPVIQLFPKAALAAVLVFTGIKLASPRKFVEIYKQGLEQLVFLISTVVITLYKDPLIGLLGGMAITLVAHLLISRVSIPQFIQMVVNSGTRLRENQDGSYTLKVKGVANFLSMLRLKGLLETVPAATNLQVDLSRTRLVDLTFQEKLIEFRREHRLTGGKVQIVGLTQHVAASNHKLALKSLILPNYQKASPRQQRIKKIAANNGWMYTQEEQVDSIELLEFDFFRSRPIEYKMNVIGGEFEGSNVDWEISDITFDEGAMLSKEVYKTTVQLVHLNREIPSFVLEQEGIFDKIFDRVLSINSQDIDFVSHPIFSKKLKLTGEDEQAVRGLFTSELIEFLESEEIYHIECNGNALIIFKSLRISNTGEIKNMVRFTKEFVNHLGE
ncbi:MAG: SulP family inorganic anion transporter [Crocinitomicaceae bacterium]|jgi:MFS superfamily sulfate permease-like transporter|nr:SulP family inorganic anion transporter [Crocinitomicaceae bacterium]